MAMTQAIFYLHKGNEAAQLPLQSIFTYQVEITAEGQVTQPMYVFELIFIEMWVTFQI